MIKKSLVFRLTLGVLLGSLFMPAQTAQAQWTVYDPVNHNTQLARWIDDTKKYVLIIDNAIKQYTTLRGVLAKGEELVTDRLVSKETMKELGLTVRTSLELKNEVQSLIKTRLTMLNSIDDRLRRGIFDPDADLRDLEDYLRTSIGRSSQDSLANLERLLRMDNVLERLVLEWRKNQAGLAKTEAELDLLNKTLTNMQRAPVGMVSTESIDTVIKTIKDNEALKKQYKDRISDLWGKIEERVRKYHGLTDARIRFGEQVKSTNQSWSKFNEKLIEIQKSLETF